MDKCCICGKEDKFNQTVQSALVKEDRTYCLDCSVKHIEPYDDLVTFGWEYSWFNKAYRDKVVYPSLQYYNKDIKQFNSDVEKLKEDKENG